MKDDSMHTPDHGNIIETLDQATGEYTPVVAQEGKQIRGISAALEQQLAMVLRQQFGVHVAGLTARRSSKERILSSEQLLDTTSAQYDASYAAWKSIIQLPENYLANMANKDTVMAWVKTIPLETIQAFRKYGSPRLKLLTEMPVQNLLEILGMNSIGHGLFWSNQWRTVAAKPGEFGITPSISDPNYEWRVVNRRQLPQLKNIIAECKQQFGQIPLATIMPQSAFLSSLADEIVRDDLGSAPECTGFEVPQGDFYLPIARWSDGCMHLGGVHPDDINHELIMCGRMWVPGGNT